jgi:peptidyl-prolyl cis-trans isomerase A (cyclophilin A)
MRKQTVLIILLTGMVAAMLGAAGARAQAGAPAHHAAGAQRSSASLLEPESLKLQAPAVFDAKFTTSKGDFVVEVTRAWAPRGADRFYNLVKYHFYDGAAFFRVLEGFVVQFGINARPEVSHVWENAKIPDDQVTQSNLRGTLTFATAGPNTRTTQIFINLGNNANLNSMGFAPFGKITSGMDVVDKLYSQYGEGAPDGHGPDQNRIQSEGRAYLAKEFPLLDVIKTAVVVPVSTSTATGAAK